MKEAIWLLVGGWFLWDIGYNMGKQRARGEKLFDSKLDRFWFFLGVVGLVVYELLR